MGDDKRLGEELLKQNGIVPGQVSHGERDAIRRMLARDKARVRRMKWAAIISWLLLPSLFLLAYVVNALGGKAAIDTIGGGIMAVLFIATPYIAIVFTISYFFRSRSLNSRQIHAKLADIEEQLKRISRDGTNCRK